MEQEIRFCTTSDGVRIAYATAGEGPPVVRVLGWFTHLELEGEFPVWRGVHEGLSARHLLVRYDGRGMGLSDRDVSDFSLEAKVRDLEAVVDALNLRRFALLGTSEGGPTAISYTVRHPQRVSRLILYGSFMGGRTPAAEEAERFQAMLTLTRHGWGQDNPAFRQMWTGVFIPDADAEQIRWFNEMQKVSATPEGVVALLSAMPTVDVRELLPRVKVPTLVIHRRGDAAVEFERGRELATLIPGARFLPLEGRNHVILVDEPESEAFLKAVEGFLAEDPKSAKPKATKAAPSGLVTILFTDMEGSTALTQRLGDARAQEVLRAHNTIVRDALKAHGGSEVKHTGDGIMASFSTASGALDCAVAIQRAFASRNEEKPEAAIRVRVGLNAGEPVAEDRDIFGTAVQLAARVCAHAEPGQVVAANVVRELAAGKGFLFSDLGDVVLRGFEDPVRLYDVSWRETE
jgi:class 3 adenylate cyclase